jgi:hypothetical protein
VDAIILQKTRLTPTERKKLTPWTKITRIEEYLETLEVLRTEADDMNLGLAAWELSVFERR